MSRPTTMISEYLLSKNADQTLIIQKTEFYMKYLRKMIDISGEIRRMRNSSSGQVH